MQSECEVIQSEGILGKVIDDLDLNKEWGKKYANGDRLKTSESMALLRARIDVRPVRNTSVIEIRTYSERPQEAAKIANSLALAYLDHWSHAATEAFPPGGLNVFIIDNAVPGKSPIRPNKPLNIALGVVIGLVLGLLVGAGTFWVGLQAGKKPGAQPRG
jgi:capsular polysaccharide biosynthesis protein